MAQGAYKPTSIGQLGLGKDVTDFIADLQDQDFSFVAQDTGGYTSQDIANAIDTSGIDWSKAGGLTGEPDPAQTVNPMLQNTDGSINRDSPNLRANQMGKIGTGSVGGTLGSSTGFTLPPNLTELMNSLYAGLEEQAQDELGGLETKDFTDDIRGLIEEGRGDAQDLHDLQMEQLGGAADRREQQITEIEQELLGTLEGSEQQRMAMAEQLMTETTAREDLAKGNTLAALEAARAGLGNQVSDQFESVAGLVGGLAEQQRASSLASQERLRVVANMAAAERLAAPAKLAAEAQLAVGDEKFRMENQLRTQLAENMAQLSTAEREMVLQEAMRQEQFGIEKDQALANAMMSIGQQRVGSAIQEAQRIESVRIRQEEILQQQNFQRQMAAAAAARAAAAAKETREFQREMAEEERAYADKVRSSTWAREDQETAIAEFEALEGEQALNAWGKKNAEAAGLEWEEDAPQDIKTARTNAIAAAILNPEMSEPQSTWDVMTEQASTNYDEKGNIESIDPIRRGWMEAASPDDQQLVYSLVPQLQSLFVQKPELSGLEGAALYSAIKEDESLGNWLDGIKTWNQLAGMQDNPNEPLIIATAAAIAVGPPDNEDDKD
jgi:hypothetical protein